MPLEIAKARIISAFCHETIRIAAMSCFNSYTDCPEEKLECLGPLALRILAIAAGLALFAPLLAAFAAPFLG